MTSGGASVGCLGSGGAAGRAIGLWAAAQSLTKELALSRFSLDQLCAALSSPASRPSAPPTRGSGPAASGPCHQFSRNNTLGP